MAEILPRHYIIGIIIFTMVIVGGVAMLGELNTNDPTYVDDEKYSQFNSSFNTQKAITDNVTNIKNRLTGASTEPGLFGVLNALIQAAWGILTSIFGSFAFMIEAIDGISEMFGVPAWIPIMIGLIVTVLFTFAIFSAIFQRDI